MRSNLLMQRPRRRPGLPSRLAAVLAVAVLVGSGCGDAGGEDTASEQSSTTATAVSAEESTTSIEPEETTTSSSSSSSSSSVETETDTETDGVAGGIAAMAPLEVEELIESIGCEIHPEFGHGSGMVAFFLGGFGPGGDPPVEVDVDTSFLCSTGGDLSIVALALNDDTDAAAMAQWLATSDSSACREIGFAGPWTFLYATSDNPPDTVRLDEVMALYGGESEVTCPMP